MRARTCVAIAAVVVGLGPGLFAHAGLRFSSPMEGATLGDTPSAVQLTFGETPEPTLSTIHVVDTNGAAYHVGAPARVPDDPLSLSINVRPLGTGVYTVNWRIVSAVDGHATAGSYVFGVRTSPSAVGARTADTTISISRLEVAARWILIVGLVLLLGAASASVAEFAGPRNLWLAAAGWLLSAAGLALLAAAQTRSAGASLGNLAATSVGRALIWRAGTIGAAGIALAFAWWRARRAPARLQLAFSIVAVVTLSTIAVHVAAGHAAGGRDDSLRAVAFQWAHFAAAGIWIGGLAALLLGIRGAPSEIKAAAVRRFSTLAAAGLVVVLVTGLLRAYDELASWTDLTKTPYGLTVLVKTVLFAGIAGLGAFNRWRSVPRTSVDLGPLRTAGAGELAFAAAAFGAAALLATLVPPAAARVVPGISASGEDFGTTLRVSLSAASDQPGPNRFVARILDYDSKQPVAAERVTLRFTPLDDPDVPTTSLAMVPGSDREYAGSGANLSFDGRWRVSVGVERAGSSVEVPLDVNVRSRKYPTTVTRLPGSPVKYTVDVLGAAMLRFSVDPERAGHNRLTIACYDFIGDERRVGHMVATLASGDNPPRQLPLQRASAGTFVTDIDLEPGPHTLAAVARTIDGTRVRATVPIDVPAR